MGFDVSLICHGLGLGLGLELCGLVDITAKVSPTMFISGKCAGRPTVAAVSAGSSKVDPLLFIFDRNSEVRFLVDTGAKVSVTPASSHDRRCGTKGQPQMARMAQLQLLVVFYACRRTTATTRC